MTNQENRKLRIDGCAWIALNEAIEQANNAKWLNLNSIMYAHDTDWIGAARIYVKGGINQLKRNGILTDDAIAVYEERQIGDCHTTGNNQSSIIGPDPLAREIERIDKINNADVSYYCIQGIKDDQGNWKTFDQERNPVYPKDIVSKKSHESTGKQYGKVLGEMMLQWDNQESRLDPAVVYTDNQIQAIYARRSEYLPKYFAEYISRLSPTRRNAIYAIARSDIPADQVYSLASRKGDNGKKTQKLAWKAYRLYSSNPHKDAIDPIEWIEMIRQYVDCPIKTDTYTASNSILVPDRIERAKELLNR